MDHLEFKAAITVDDTGTLTGIAWPFGTVDLSGDVIEKGAFSSPAKLPMLFAHDQAQAIGVWDSITETTDGLTVKGRLLVNDVQRAKEVHTLIKEQAVNGLSIGFVTRKAAPRSGGGRTITALDLHEVSVVPVPMNPGSRITSAKAAGAAETQGVQMDNEQVAAPEIAAIEAKLNARLDKMEAKLNRPAVNTDAQADEDLERKAFINFARKGIERMAPDEVKALTVSTAATAGYLAPPSFANEIVKLLREFSPIRQYAKVVSIGAPELKLPRRTGSSVAYWTAEGAAWTGSQPAYEQLSLTPYELNTYVDVSNALLEDNAYNLEGELASDLAESFAIKEGTAFVSGTGTGQPSGMLLAGAITNEVKTGVAADLPATDAAIADKLFDVFHAIPTTHAQNGVWVMNRTILARLRKVKDTTGAYLLVPNLANGPAWSILGRPVVEATDMPGVAASANVIVFGDLQGFRIVDRVGFTMLRDPYSQSANGIVRFLARKRVGASVTNPDRLVRLKCST